MEADHRLPRKNAVDDALLLGDYLQQHLQKSGNNHLLHYRKSSFSMRSESQSVPKSEEANSDPSGLLKVASSSSSSSVQSKDMKLHRSCRVFSSKEEGNQKQLKEQSWLLNRSFSSSVSCAQSSQCCESSSSLKANLRSTSMESRKRRQGSCDNVHDQAVDLKETRNGDVDDNGIFMNQFSAFDLLVSAAFKISEAEVEEGDAKNSSGSPVKSVDGPVSVYGGSPLPKKRVCRRAKNVFQKKQNKVGHLGTSEKQNSNQEDEGAAISAKNAEELGNSDAKKDKECEDVAIDVNTGQGTHQRFAESNTLKSQPQSGVVQYNRRKSHGKTLAQSKIESTNGVHKGEELQKNEKNYSLISKSEANFNEGLRSEQELDDTLPPRKSEANYNEGLRCKQELDSLSANTSKEMNDLENLPFSNFNQGLKCKQEFDVLSANTSKQKNGLENLPICEYDAKFNEGLNCKEEEDSLSASLAETVVSSTVKKIDDAQCGQLTTSKGLECPNHTEIGYDPRTPSPPSSKNTTRVRSDVHISENAHVSFIGNGKPSRQSKMKVKGEPNEALREDVKVKNTNPVIRIKFLPIKLPSHSMPALQDVSKHEDVPPTSMVTRKRKQLLDKQQLNDIATPTAHDKQSDIKKEDFVVRTKCGRSQVLPMKYSDSIIQSWKRTQRTKHKGKV